MKGQDTPHGRRRSFLTCKALANDCRIEAIISDFEPLSCHVGHKKRLPVISIDNQHCLTNTNVEYPRQYARDATAAKLVTRMMVPRANAYLVTTFFTPEVTRKNTWLFPPLLREQISKLRRGTASVACLRDLSGAGFGAGAEFRPLPIYCLRFWEGGTGWQYHF